MAKKTRLTAKIKDGNIVWDNEKYAVECLISLESSRVYVDIEPSKIRNIAQNNYYWTIVQEIADNIGYTKQEMHELVKHKFGIESTSKLTKDDFHELLSNLIRWCAEVGFPIRDPRY